MYLIGVDIGTQGTKAALFDEALVMVETAFEDSRLIQPEPGVVWQEADDIYGSVARTVKALLQKSRVKAADVAAVGIDSQMAGIMGIDSAGEASTYYDSWLDTRCKKYVAMMKDRAEKRVIELTGSPVTFTHGPKMLWWKHEEPAAFKKTAKFVLPHAYVVGKMCGIRGDESYFDWTHLQYSGFADNLAKTWSGELLSLFDMPAEKMARIVSPFEIAGKTTKDFEKLTGLPAGVPVAAGAGDTAASILGAGLFRNDEILDCAGTASVLCCAVDSYAPDTRHKTMMMMRSPEDGRFFPLTYINGGGLCIRWFRDNFTGSPPVPYKELEAEAAKIPAGSEGLVFVPHFAGRVLPSDPNLKGSYSGLDLRHTRAHLFRAILEGIAYEYAYYVSVLRDLYPASDFTTMTSIGGGSKSPFFVSVKADVTGLSVRRSEVGDTALVGSAAIAGYGAGLIKDYRKAILATVKEDAPVMPCKANHEAYRPMTAKYLETIALFSGGD